MLRLVGLMLVLSFTSLPTASLSKDTLSGVALVIGETNYIRLATLANPEQDARDIDHLLDDLGFAVTRALDVRSQTLRSKIDDFIEEAKEADVALIYYAGHGIEAGGRNYIMGTDADISDATSAAETLVSLDEVLDRLQATVPITIMLLDACRTNPFGVEVTLLMNGDTGPLPIGAAGLGAVRGPVVPGREQGTSHGMVVGFSASPGQSALDGPAGENSPYASALLQHLSASGYSFGDIMTMVTQEVYVATGARQLPWTNSSLTNVLYFGRDADTTSGDEAEIVGDRRQLLLSIATVPADSKAFVETVARQENLRLADLYSMLDIIHAGKGDIAGQDRQALIEVAGRVREVLDDPILSGAPSDPELLRLDELANEAIEAGAFKRAYKYRQQQAKVAAKIEKSLDAQQADIDAKRRELAGVYARVAEAAMYTLNPKAANEAYRKAAKQSDLFDKTISIRLRLRAANLLADELLRKWDVKTGLTAVALYQDILGEIDREASEEVWADTQLRLAETMYQTSNSRDDHGLKAEALAAAREALAVFKADTDFRRWSRAMRVVAAATRNLGQVDESLGTYEALLDATDMETYPLDWAQEQHAFGELLTDLGYWYHEVDIDLLGRAAEAYGAAAVGAARYDAYAARYSRVRKANAQTHVALRTNDLELLGRAIDDGETALAEYGRPNNAQWALSALTVGQNQVLAGIALDDSKLVKTALANFAAAEKVITPKNLAYDWAMSKLAEGDALKFLGLKSPQSNKQLKAAIAAYRDGIAVMEDIGNLNPYVVFARTKMVRLQDLIGAKISPDDRAIASIPEPATIAFDTATVTFQRGFAQDDIEQFAIRISDASAMGQPWAFSFMLETGYRGSSKQQRNLSYLQAKFYSSQLTEATSQNADYSDCGSDEGSGGRLKLFYGRQSATNACVLSKMGEADAAIWQTVLIELPAILQTLGDRGDPDAARVSRLFELMPLLQ